MTPLLTRILNRYTPANQQDRWEVEEIETRNPDGTIIIQRKRIHSKDEERPWITPPADPSPDKPLLSDGTDKNR